MGYKTYLLKSDATFGTLAIFLLFLGANGEVPCDQVISTEIIQFGIILDMYVMNGSPSVISIGRLVVVDAYDLIWRRNNRQPVLVSADGARHELWTGKFTPMFSIKYSPSQPKPANVYDNQESHFAEVDECSNCTDCQVFKHDKIIAIMVPWT